jgi:hypothetical protein
MIGTIGKRTVEIIIMLMTRKSPAGSEARRRRLTEGLLGGWHGIFDSFLG